MSSHCYIFYLFLVTGYSSALERNHFSVSRFYASFHMAKRLIEFDFRHFKIISMGLCILDNSKMQILNEVIFKRLVCLLLCWKMINSDSMKLSVKMNLIKKFLIPCSISHSTRKKKMYIQFVGSSKLHIEQLN